MVFLERAPFQKKNPSSSDFFFNFACPQILVELLFEKNEAPNNAL